MGGSNSYSSSSFESLEPYLQTATTANAATSTSRKVITDRTISQYDLLRQEVLTEECEALRKEIDRVNEVNFDMHKQCSLYNEQGTAMQYDIEDKAEYIRFLEEDRDLFRYNTLYHPITPYTTPYNTLHHTL